MNGYVRVCKALGLLAAFAAAFAIQNGWAAEKSRLNGTGIYVSTAGKQVGYEADNPKREMSQFTNIWTFTSSNPDFDGLVETAPTQIVCTPSGCRHQGQLVFRLKNGDQVWGHFYGTHSIAAGTDGKWTLSSDGIKVLEGGTGKYANIKGTLKYGVKNEPYGATFQYTGEIEY
jgi:hypothetical protein